MKKVMLVDDEILIRETVRDCIPWEREGYVFCGEASDGEMALPLLEQLQPDILITDIKMPFMNGLELSALVRQRLPHIKIIILSGHGEFEYARQALRMGIEEYCLKPVSSSELLSILHSVSVKIDKEKEEQERLERLKLRQQESAGMAEDKLYNDLCSGFITASEAIQRSGSLAVNLIARCYAVVIADLRLSEHDGAVEGNSRMKQAEEEVLQQFDSLRDQTGSFMFKRSRTKTVWILKGDHPDQLQHNTARFESARALLAEQQQVSVSMGVGSIQERLQGIQTSFHEAEEDMHWQRLSRQNRRALCEYSSGALAPGVYLDRAQFADFVKIGTPGEAEAFVTAFAEGLRPIDWQASLVGYFHLNDLTLEVFRLGQELCKHPDASGESLARFQQEIEAIRSWEEACAYIMKLAGQFWQWRAGAAVKYGDLLQKVKAYILANYDKDSISLQEAADHVNVSASHLSKVFSQETGQTFIEYLTRTRMRKAMELLQTTPAKSYEVAFQVGYHDPHYFSNLFKRTTGMTTREFRRRGLSAELWPGGKGEAHESGSREA